jgi:hypothetical protein
VSSATAGLIGALGGAAIAGLLAWALSATSYARQRKDLLRDRLYSGRRDAYVSFLDKTQATAHELGKLASDPAVNPPAGADLFAITYVVDAVTNPQLRVVEIVGPQQVLEAAEEMRDGLYGLRDVLLPALRNGAPIPYSDVAGSPYMEAREPFRRARETFLARAKAELERFDR